ncbi:hypothetical protein A3F38_00570 [Candidatus Saccharibacteria bacterium RIFCSPHIGHO2_12_FULL_48_21]|nr:MAG: hypothetical protein A3F38_00570 [Candidatus Saccharibacteria bacterium RIFCSPHIGHO2_12_FULL_48_21]
MGRLVKIIKDNRFSYDLLGNFHSFKVGDIGMYIKDGTYLHNPIKYNQASYIFIDNVIVKLLKEEFIFI